MTSSRLAAEALFEEAPQREPASPAPQVVIRRRKVVVPQPTEATQDAKSEPTVEHRAPKVYRLETSAAAMEPHEAGEGSTHDHPATLPEQGLRRRRVREDCLPSAPVVTRLRPDAGMGPTAKAQDTVISGGQDLRDIERELVQNANRRLEETIAEIADAQRWKFIDNSLESDWERIAGLLEKTSDDIKRALAKAG